MILENIVLVIGLIGLGSLAKRSRIFPANTAEVLNVFILNISLPAIILVNIPKMVLDSKLLIPVAVHWVAFLVHVLILFCISKFIKMPRKVFGTLLIVTTLGNTAFLGIPLSTTFFGDDAIAYAVLYDQLGSGFGFIIMAAFVLPLYVGKKVGNPRDVMLGLLKFPPFVALALGFLFMFLPMPAVAENYLNSIADTLIPCAMIAVGFQMKYKLPRSILAPLSIGLFVKLLVLPLFMLFLVSFFDRSNIAMKVSLLQSGMPPMITAGAMVINEKMEEDLCTSLVGYGLIFSFVSLSFLNYLTGVL